MSDLSEQIENNAAQPKKVTIQGNSAEQHSLQDQIEADKYLASKAAAQSSNLGLRRKKISYPGAT